MPNSHLLGFAVNVEPRLHQSLDHPTPRPPTATRHGAFRPGEARAASDTLAAEPLGLRRGRA
eukprot:2428111-Prymnesium_polylepis.1